MEGNEMFKITKDMLDTQITDANGIEEKNNTYREFLETSWSRFTSSSTIPDFEKLGNSHLSAMLSYFVAKQHEVTAA